MSVLCNPPRLCYFVLEARLSLEADTTPLEPRDPCSPGRHLNCNVLRELNPEDPHKPCSDS